MIILSSPSDVVSIARTFSACCAPDVTVLCMILQHTTTNEVYVVPVPDTMINDVRYTVALTMPDGAEYGEYEYHLAEYTGDGVTDIDPNAVPPVTGDIKVFETGLLQYPSENMKVENNNAQVYGQYERG